MKTSEIIKSIKNVDNLYIQASIEGVGVHIGRIKGLSYDADGDPILEVDIDAVSCTTENYLIQHMFGTPPVIKCFDAKTDTCIGTVDFGKEPF